MLPLMAMADEAKVMYAKTTLASGDSVVSRLYDDGITVRPVIYTSSRTIVMNGKSYSIDEIESIRFEVRVEEVSGIKAIEAHAATEGKVYTLDGKLVSETPSTEGLDKGVYIINKKKIVVK